jgi:hypothetical protein
VSERVGTGPWNPLPDTVADPCWPTVSDVEPLGLPKLGTGFTVSTKLWLAVGLTPLEAVSVRGYVPPAPTGGVPAMVAVPLPLFKNVTLCGRVPVWETAIPAPPGNPVVVTVKEPADPVVNVACDALVTAGA